MAQESHASEGKDSDGWRDLSWHLSEPCAFSPRESIPDKAPRIIPLMFLLMIHLFLFARAKDIRDTSAGKTSSDVQSVMNNF